MTNYSQETNIKFKNLRRKIIYDKLKKNVYIKERTTTHVHASMNIVAPGCNASLNPDYLLLYETRNEVSWYLNVIYRERFFIK